METQHPFNLNTTLFIFGKNLLFQSKQYTEFLDSELHMEELIVSLLAKRDRLKVASIDMECSFPEESELMGLFYKLQEKCSLNTKARLNFMSLAENTLLENYLSSAFSCSFQSMADYTLKQNKKFNLFKPNGSWNWRWILTQSKQKMEVITDFNSLSYFPVLKLDGIQKAQVYLPKEQYETLKDLLLQVKTVCVLGSIESDIHLLKELFKQSIYLKQVLSFDNEQAHLASLFKELKTEKEISLHYYENLQQLLDFDNWI